MTGHNKNDRSRGLLASHDLNCSSNGQTVVAFMFIKERPIGDKDVTDWLLASAKSTLRYLAGLCWLLFA